MGPAGPQGEQGIQGVAGPIGPQGLAGADGVDGEVGPAGATGATGPAGPQGEQGLIGATGPKGDTGDQGLQGLQGETGPIGPIGLTGAAGVDGADGATGATGPAGPQGEQGIQGIAGVDGINGVDGAVGPQGPIGLTGPQGEQGIQGVAGSDGINGVDGAVGPQGVAGADGATGATGPAGPQGEQGIQGIAGVDGTNGVDGAIGPQGEVGPMGPQGLAGTNGVDGAVGPAGADGATGPAGPQGLQGLQGEQGLTGSTGATGPAGPQGEQGIQGVAGADGLNGVDGAVGPQGPIGLTGPQGEVGPMGPQGLAGADGAAGATGPAGPQGEQGIQGIAGVDGTNGVDGAIGPQGEVGPMGPQGLAGTNGVDGAVGPAGADGATGPAGPQGEQGIQGIAGPQGEQGIQGVAGANGVDGINGVDGAVGATGPEGPMGPQGPQGLTGADGAIGPQGLQGPIGLTGPEGPQGSTGLTGPQGPAGSPDTQADILGKLAQQADGMVLTVRQGATEAASALKFDIKDATGISKLNINSGGTVTSYGYYYSKAFSDTPGVRPVYGLERSRGTVTSPTVVQLNDKLGTFAFSGYDGGAQQSGALIEGFVDGAVSGGVVPTRLSIVTGSSMSNRAERLVVKNDGNIGIGTTAPTQKLEVNGNIKATAFIGDGSQLTNLPTGGSWGSITGTISNQTDLQSSLNAKQNVLGFTPENEINKGIANGYAALDATGKVPATQLPASETETQSSILSKIATQTNGAVLTVQQGATETAGAIKLAVKDSAGNNAYSMTSNGIMNILGAASQPSLTLQMHGDVSGQRPVFVGNRSRGTASIPLAVQTGDKLGTLAFAGHDGTAFQSGALMEVFVDGTVSAGSVPQRFSIVTGSAPSNRAERLVVKNDGNVGIGTTAPSQRLEVAGGVRLNTVAAKPTCDDATPTTRGTIWVTQGAADDTVEVCAKVEGVLQWKKLLW